MKWQGVGKSKCFPATERTKKAAGFPEPGAVVLGTDKKNDSFFLSKEKIRQGKVDCDLDRGDLHIDWFL